MKNVRTWKTAILTGAFITLAATMIGCNNNSVTIAGAGSSPLSGSVDTGLTAKPQIDILFVIDDSGSMSEEQYQLSRNFDDFVKIIANLDIDAHIAITSTNSVIQSSTNAKRKFPSGVFFKKTSGEMYSNVKESMKKTPDSFKNFYNTAWNCTGKTAPHTADQAFNDLKADQDIFTDSTSSYFPKSSDYPLIAPDGFLDINKYSLRDPSGAINASELDKLKKDFKCLTLVGLGGNFIEMGIKAAVNAVDPNGPNKSELSKFIRPNAKFGVIIVSDENDCSLPNQIDLGLPNPTKIDANAAICPTVCEYLNNRELLPPDFPQILDDPKASAKNLIKHLKTIKGADSAFTESDVLAMTIAGPNIKEAKDTTPLGFSGSVPNWNNFSSSALENSKNQIIKTIVQPLLTKACVPGAFTSLSLNDGANSLSYGPIGLSSDTTQNYAACQNSLGKATSSSRYQEFISSFTNSYPPYQQFPQTIAGKAAGAAQSFLCQGNFRRAWNQLGELVKTVLTNQCISIDQLKGACASKAAGAKCGDGSGTCKSIPNASDMYCSSLVQIVLLADSSTATKLKNAKSGSTPYCKPNTYGKVPNEHDACILNESLYKFEQCYQGMKFTYNDPNQAATDLSGIKTEVRFTSIN